VSEPESTQRFDLRSPEMRDQLGARLRAAREARSISLRSMASRIGVSPSFISQIERGQASPSVSNLFAYVTELGLTLDEIMAPEAGGGASADRNGDRPRFAALSGGESAGRGHNRGGGRITAPVQRSGESPRIEMSGVIWERLTKEPDPKVDFLRVVYEPGAASSPENAMQRHAGFEYGHVVRGRMRMQIGFDVYELEPGDSVHLDSMTPHRLWNPYEEPCISVWANVHV